MIILKRQYFLPRFRKSQKFISSCVVFLKLQHHYVKNALTSRQKGGLRLCKERRADVFGRGSIPVIYQGVGDIYTVTLSQCISLNVSLDCPVL